VVRQAAVVGAISAVALRPHTVARPRLDQLLSDSAMCVILADQSAAPAAPPTRQHPAATAQGVGSKKDDILRAALGLFARQGYAGVGIDEIGAAVGISGPTIYHYYPDKAEILLDAYERAGVRVMEGIEAALTEAASPDEALVRLALSYVEVALDNADLIVVTSREGAALPEGARPTLAARRHRVRNAWTDVLVALRPSLGPEEARTLVAGAFPLTNAVAQLPGRRPAAAAVAQLVAGFCRGTNK
jgi:AcrR family transcriptional regulator